MSHKAHALVDLRTGRVGGLTELLVLDPLTSDVLLNDPDAFGRLLRDYAYHVAKFSFVFELFPCRYQQVITDEFLHDYRHMTGREEITSLTRDLLHEKIRCWCTSRDLMFGFTGGISGCRHYGDT
jgi:hypothetical protein